MSNKIFLVSCVGSKKNVASPAAELYVSPWFRKARTFVEATGDPWFILSAEHGLISPSQLIRPYDRTLNTMRLADRIKWADKVKEQMDAMLPNAEEMVIFAGARYRENLMSYLESRFSKISIPMAGLSIGRQLSWLNNATTS